MKDVMIYAYTRLNLGDDLFVKILCERYPNINFRIICIDKYASSFDNIENLKCYKFNSYLERGINYIFRKIGYVNFLQDRCAKKCDIGITVGGSIFMETNQWLKGIEDFGVRLRINKDSYILGANFGPYKSDEFYFSYKKIFSQFKQVSFRDSYSYDLFCDLNNTTLFPDIVFGVPDKYLLNQTNNTIVISVIKPSERGNLKEYDIVYYKKISEFIAEFSERGFNVTLMSFCKDEGDEEAIQNIMNILPNKYTNNVKQYLYNGNIDESMKILASCRAIVATRFHAMILGMCFNKPVFSIIYSEKMKNVLDDLNVTSGYIYLSDISNLDINKEIKFINEEILDVELLKSNSKRHFYELDKKLGEYK